MSQSRSKAALSGPVYPPDPAYSCRFCPRLAVFLDGQRVTEPTWHNGPVPSFGSPDARVLIVGLAPGLTGANRTGRPFTGDHAGELLYGTLIKTGFARGTYGAAVDDGLTLVDCMISNAVRCVPPQNKPTPAEIRTCNGFLASRIASLANVIAIVALGRIAHDATIAALPAARMISVKKKDVPFAHGAVHRIVGAPTIFDSYHCSRYNTNTGVLTPDMFRAVFASVRAEIDATPAPKN